MALVAYSDSEGSEDEKIQPQQKVEKPATRPSTNSASNFSVNKANPRKIQVKIQNVPTNGDTDGEPAAKRPRLGAARGASSGFNAMLPAPKRDADAKAPSKPAARKVFSLKTGAEPGFSRESDAELKELFTGQESQNGNADLDADDTVPSIQKSTNPQTTNTASEKPVQGSTFMFKPLSVARTNKKPNSKPKVTKPNTEHNGSTVPASNGNLATDQTGEPAPPPKKVSLFSMNGETEAPVQFQLQDEEDEIIEVLDEAYDESTFSALGDAYTTAPDQSQSLDAIASDLNLSKADRRQLFGRRGQQGGTAINVVNFNTDQEYAANEELRATGEQVQHNPVRAIASGKHSLKQLVGAAVGQKDALEESFATGRRNKKEAGNKYGW